MSLSEITELRGQRAADHIYFKLKEGWDDHIAHANKYHGYFVLVSNKEKDPFKCLLKYRERETIESFFEAGKQHADGSRSRVWNTDTLRGRMFVQFVSLCYYEYFSEEIRKLKATLDEEILYVMYIS